MALTRSFMKGMGLTEEQISAIIDAHTETVNGLKSERDNYKQQAEENAKAQDALDKYLKEEWQSKYEKEHKDFETYKSSIASQERLNTIKDAYRKLLLSQNVGEKHIDSILRVTDFKDFKLGEDGKLADEAKLVESIKNDWSGFISTVSTKGMNVDKPPITEHAKLTKEDIYKKDDHGRYLMSTSERQKALMENFSQ